MTAPRADYLELIRRSGLLDPEHPLGSALREAIAEFVVQADGCTDAVACATEQHPEARAHPIEFLDWLRLEVDPPRYNTHGSHLTLGGRARIVAGQRRRWHRSESASVA